MIGHRLRTVLTVAAYLLIGLGLWRAVSLLHPFMMGWPTPEGFIGSLERAVWSVMSYIVQAGVLLVLLSIDNRIRTRGQ